MIRLEYGEFKTAIFGTGLPFTELSFTGHYRLYAQSGALIFWTSVASESPDETDYEANYQATKKENLNTFQSITPTTGAPVVAIERAEGKFESLYTHDLTSDHSSYTLTPSTGKVLRLNHAEVQFTSDITWHEPIHFDVMVGATVVDRTTYSDMKDLLSVANKGYSIDGLPQFANKVFVLPFDYAMPIDIKSSLGMSMRVSFNDENATPNPMTGEFCTITFYTVEINE